MTLYLVLSLMYFWQLFLKVSFSLGLNSKMNSFKLNICLNSSRNYFVRAGDECYNGQSPSTEHISLMADCLLCEVVRCIKVLSFGVFGSSQLNHACCITFVSHCCNVTQSVIKPFGCFY